MNDELENTISSDETVEETQDTVENTQEGLTEEPTVQEEETQEEEVQEQEDEIFNPDDLDFSESPEDYKFGDYDLSEFKDVIDLTRDDVREALNTKANELKEQGFTQQQISYLFKKEVEYAKQQNQRQALNRETVKKELEQSLTVQQKRDYKATGTFLKEALDGDSELSKLYNEAMSNPAVYKLVHRIYTKSLNGKSLNSALMKNKEVRSPGTTLDQAVNEYTEFLQANLGNGEDRTPVVNKILAKLSKENKEKFKKTFGL